MNFQLEKLKMTTIETELINSTIDALKELISRPPLTEKLLSRPPFKYILDICKAVSAVTGFPSPESCNHDDITDREERAAFLSSVIGQISDQLGVPVDVQIKSILAGKDVPKTLRMLVMLAQAAKLFKVGSTPLQQQQAPKEAPAAPPQEDLEALARERAEKERHQREQEQREQQERERKEQERRERERRELEARERAEKEKQQQQQQQQQQKQQQQQPVELSASPQKSPPKVRFADDETAKVEDHRPIIERPHFNRPPPSQHSRRMAVTATAESTVPQPSAMRLVKVIREESSDENDQDIVQNDNQDGGFTIGLDSEWCEEMLPSGIGADDGASLPSGAHGELVANILDTAEEYNVALHGDSKRPTGLSNQKDKKPMDSHSQPVQKLISHISTIIRKSVPYTKHTAFLDEHILTMRTELHTASEAVTKLLSTSLKQESSLKQANNACESKIHSLKEQIYSLRQTQLELLHSTLVL